MRRLLTGLLALACVWGCGEQPPPTRARDADVRRIVCLVPAVTLMLIDLGLGDEIVGVNEYDTHAATGVPVVSSYPQVDIEKLLATDPTWIIGAQTKDFPPPRLSGLARERRISFAVVEYPHSVADVLDTLHDPEHGGLGQAMGLRAEAEQLRTRMRSELDAIQTRTAGLPTRRVLVCFGLSPVMASGPGTVNHDLLGYINATNAAGDSAIPAPTFDREQLLAMRPDVILLLMPGAPALEANDPRLAQLRGLNTPAVHDGRVFLINDPHCLLPGTNLPQLAREMAHLVHGIEIKDGPADE